MKTENAIITAGRSVRQGYFRLGKGLSGFHSFPSLAGPDSSTPETPATSSHAQQPSMGKRSTVSIIDFSREHLA